LHYACISVHESTLLTHYVIALLIALLTDNIQPPYTCELERMVRVPVKHVLAFSYWTCTGAARDNQLCHTWFFALGTGVVNMLNDSASTRACHAVQVSPPAVHGLLCLSQRAAGWGKLMRYGRFRPDGLRFPSEAANLAAGGRMGDYHPPVLAVPHLGSGRRAVRTAAAGDVSGGRAGGAGPDAVVGTAGGAAGVHGAGSGPGGGGGSGGSSGSNSRCRCGGSPGWRRAGWRYAGRAVLHDLRQRWAAEGAVPPAVGGKAAMRLGLLQARRGVVA
jgi:hypothetical protein